MYMHGARVHLEGSVETADKVIEPPDQNTPTALLFLPSYLFILHELIRLGSRLHREVAKKNSTYLSACM